MFFNYPESSLNLDVSGQLKVPIPAIAGISAALTPAHFAASCTHLDQDHQDVHPAGEKEQGEKALYLLHMSILLVRAGIPVRFFGPRESPVPGRVLKMCTSWAQDSWFYPSASMAHGVGSKEEVLVIERG